jgi:hypothetical protein
VLFRQRSLEAQSEEVRKQRVDMASEPDPARNMFDHSGHRIELPGGRML